MKAAIAAAVVLLLVEGCSQGGHATTAASAARKSASPGVPGWETTPDLPVSKVSFHCRLPIAVSGEYPIAAQGGFITFPAASFHADPNGKIRSLFTQEAGEVAFATVATPVLGGDALHAISYDSTAQRWIPAGSYQLSPDGEFYAYALAGPYQSGRSSIHVGDVVHGTERVFTVASPTPFSLGVYVWQFDGTYVYFSNNQMEAHPAGIWRLDVSNGSVTALSRVGGVMALRVPYAWFGRDDPRDPSPPRYPRGGEFHDSVIRLDLSTGSETEWTYVPGQPVVVRGLTQAGWPVIGPDETLGQGDQSWQIVTSPGGSGVAVYSGTPQLYLFSPLADGGRLWFGSFRGIYLWTAADGMRKVFSFRGNPPGVGWINAAGACQ